MFGTYLSRRPRRTSGLRPPIRFFCMSATLKAFPLCVSRRILRATLVPGVPGSRVSSEERRQVPPVFRHVIDEQTCGIQAAYATCTEFIDRNVGIVLDAPAESRSRRTRSSFLRAITATSSGSMDDSRKQTASKRRSRGLDHARSRRAKTPGVRTSARVQLMDLVPTVLELCGLPLPSRLQGQSLGPLLRNESSEHRQELFFEYSDNAEAAVFSGSWKAIYTSNERRARGRIWP